MGWNGSLMPIVKGFSNTPIQIEAAPGTENHARYHAPILIETGFYGRKRLMRMTSFSAGLGVTLDGSTKEGISC